MIILPLTDSNQAVAVELINNQQDGGSGRPLFELADPVSGNKATIAQFHNADNQSLGGSAYGINTGGVAQIINAVGNLDRQGEASFDGISVKGVQSGTSQLASPFNTTIAAAITSTGSQVVTPVAMNGVNRGGAWAITQNMPIIVDQGNANQETIWVTAITSTTFTAIFNKTHSANVTLNSFVLNMARDATIPDGSTGKGITAGATYLYNPTLNSQAGGWEAARSALGEQDSASGTGSSIAVGYEYNGLTYDRERNLQSKGFNSAPFTSSDSGGFGVGTKQITVGSTPAGLQPGSSVQLLGGVIETAVVSQTWVPGTTVTFQSNIINSGHNTLIWETFAANGPGLNGFTPIGIGIEEESVYDPITGYFYIERAATADGVSGQNLVMESLGYFNGTTFDRAKGGLSTAQSSATGMGNTIPMAVYSSGTITLTANQVAPLQVDINNNLKMTMATAIAGEDLSNLVLAITQRPVASMQYSTTSYQNLGATTTGLIKNAQGNLFAFIATNVNAAGRWLMFFNSTSAPTSGTTVPAEQFYVPAGSTTTATVSFGQNYFGMGGVGFSTGIYMGWSSTINVYTSTSVTASDHSLIAKYV